MKTENCHHQYSKSISEPRPRKCVRCGHIEDWKPEPLPQTSLSQTIPVNRFDAEMYINTLESDIAIWGQLSSDTAKARVQITQQHLDMAKKLFKIEDK